jgi:hypothetical protein
MYAHFTTGEQRFSFFISLFFSSFFLFLPFACSYASRSLLPSRSSWPTVDAAKNADWIVSNDEIIGEGMELITRVRFVVTTAVTMKNAVF